MVEDAMRAYYSTDHSELKGLPPYERHRQVKFIEESERDWQDSAQAGIPGQPIEGPFEAPTSHLKERVWYKDIPVPDVYRPSFYTTIREVVKLHDMKNQDYGTDADPFANVRQSEQFGVPAWLGAIVRLNDKITRIKAWTRNKSLANESLRDSLIDIVVYGAIAVTLFDQEHEEGPSTFCP